MAKGELNPPLTVESEQAVQEAGEARRRSPVRSAACLVRLVLSAILVVLVLFTLSEARSGGRPLVLARTGSSRQRVGLLAGHWQHDSGAVCGDGLQEAEVNLAIARRVAHLLLDAGIEVDLLPEYSPLLQGYRADAFLAIHCDSCLSDLSGFKLACITGDEADTEEARLVDALYASYEAETGLKPHLDTITDDMREYHALRRIAPGTPGAIIECGFLGGDRGMLTEEQGRVARGIATGLLQYLRERADSASAVP